MVIFWPFQALSRVLVNFVIFDLYGYSTQFYVFHQSHKNRPLLMFVPNQVKPLLNGDYFYSCRCGMHCAHHEANTKSQKPSTTPFHILCHNLCVVIKGGMTGPNILPIRTF